jgi:hypothetical protein
MSERTPRRFAIAAATACLFGIVVPTATAGALPPLPAAPACAWTLNGPIRINHSDGVVVTIDMWRGGHPDGAAHEFSKDGKEVILDSNGHPPGGGLTAPFGSAQTGEVHGGINGDTITFKIDWALPINKTSTNGYSGTIDQAGRASGITQNSINGLKTNWSIDKEFTCGQPSAGLPAQGPAPAAPPVNCPAGSVSGTVPAGQQCQALPPPTNAVTFTFQKKGLQIQAIIVNKSTVAGQCHYDARNTNGIIPETTDDFPIGAKATVIRTFTAPPPLAKFHATVTCTGDFNGKSDEFGNTSADVTGG